MITNRTLVQGSFLEQMEKVVCLHPQGVILRERDLSDEEYEALAEKVLGICARERYRVSFTPESRLPGGLAVQISICRFRMCSQCRRQRGKNFGGTLHK